MLLSAIPDIIREFGITYSISSWVFTSIVVSALISTTILSKLSDMYGKKSILLVVLTIYIIGIIGGALSNNIYFMILFRIIQGIGMSAFPLVFTIVSSQFPKEKISVGQGTLASMFAFGGVLGLVVGGNITHIFLGAYDILSIRPFAIFITMVIRYFVDIRYELHVENNERTPLPSSMVNVPIYKRLVHSKFISSFDIKGSFIFAIAITSFLFALTFVQSGQKHQELINSSIQIFFCIASILSLVAFIRTERKSPNPLINHKLLTLRPILSPNAIILLWGVATFAIFQTIPVLVELHHQWESAETR
jgi:MFS family permease